MTVRMNPKGSLPSTPNRSVPSSRPAKWLVWWADRLESEDNPTKAMAPGWAESDVGKSYVTAIRDIVCYLRQGYLMPGGLFYDEMFSEE